MVYFREFLLYIVGAVILVSQRDNPRILSNMRRIILKRGKVLRHRPTPLIRFRSFRHNAVEPNHSGRVLQPRVDFTLGPAVDGSTKCFEQWP